MANYQKYQKHAMGHMLAHYTRSATTPQDHIDPSKTHMNYNLHQQEDELSFIQQRTSEVRCMNRKDVNLMASWVITMPKDLNPNKQNDFFRSAYDFLVQKYGKDNTIGAYIHLDEKTPHMHYVFIPIVRDRKRGDLKVSAQECVTRRDLQTFHKALQAHISRDLGIEVHLLNGATKLGNRSVSELRELNKQKNKILKKQKKLKKQIDAYEARLDELEKFWSSMPQYIQDIIVQGIESQKQKDHQDREK